ncbi:T9SS C-terminal target domain-containing protein [candidate division KSB1 bacterium]|nr:T9SS type A sorting domain-containing protein [candidate division KSB1 bacterium]RQW07105.1 MAG: T9SS C-terminal target domain-containing protein [candidate division KSB1 bacterium]
MHLTKGFFYICLIFLSSLCVRQTHAEEVVNELYFTADLTDIYGTGLGFFDPNEDILNLMGLDWVGATVVEDESERRFEEDPFNPGIFTTTMMIRGQEGDSTKWKCKAEPEARFYNWGWEISPDYWYTIQEDGHLAEIEFKPHIFPIQPAIAEAVVVLFQVDMTRATNYYTQEKIDPATVEWVGLKGQNSVLGAWAGDWLPSDTLATPKTLHVLRDHGINGDKIACDSIFSAFVEFPAGNEGGPGLFKYGAYYPGALEANGGVSPLDNEMHGTDHWINIKVGGQTEVLNRFGVLEGITQVAKKTDALPKDIRLENYPNPFNPLTTIEYNLPQHAKVVLSVYTVTGRKMVELVDGSQDRGKHAVALDASDWPTGVYIVQLNADDVRLNKKIILVK